MSLVFRTRLIYTPTRRDATYFLVGIGLSIKRNTLFQRLTELEHHAWCPLVS